MQTCFINFLSGVYLVTSPDSLVSVWSPVRPTTTWPLGDQSYLICMCETVQAYNRTTKGAC